MWVVLENVFWYGITFFYYMKKKEINSVDFRVNKKQRLIRPCREKEIISAEMMVKDLSIIGTMSYFSWEDKIVGTGGLVEIETNRFVEDSSDFIDIE